MRDVEVGRKKFKEVEDNGGGKKRLDLKGNKKQLRMQ